MSNSTEVEMIDRLRSEVERLLKMVEHLLELNLSLRRQLMDAEIRHANVAPQTGQ